MTATPSIRDLQEGDAPFVLADHNGNILAINGAFENVYGWTQQELIGQPVTLILPESFRMSHVLGFSRYQSTHKSTVLGHPLRLYTVCRDGRELMSEHFIIAESSDEGWLFGATLTPLADGGEANAAIS